jgi:signal transduction histidine kinase
LPRKFKLIAKDEIHPDDVPKVRRFYEKLRAGDSEIQDTDFRVYPSNKARVPENMRWVYCRANLIEYQGEDAILINMMDTTRAKKLEHLLGLQDKMTSLGHVAAGIAHEIRNPLSGFNIYLKTLEKIYNKEDSREKVEKILKQLQSASNKIESVIKRVMDFSKPSEPKFTYIDLNQPVEDAIDLSSVTMRKSGIQIQKKLERDLPKCHADSQMIEQVILNLITNAAEAMKEADGPKKIEINSFAERGFVGLKVCDSGPGIPLPAKEKIFDPFYTTKTDSSGIGLSICHRIITDHSGSLGVSNSKLGGAEFTIKIPLNKRSASK